MSIRIGKLKLGGRHKIEIGGHSVNPIDHAQDAVHEVEGVVKNALHEVEGAGNQVLHEVEGAGNQVLHEVEGAAQNALREIEHGIEALRDEIFKGLAKLTLDKAIGVIEETLPDVFTLTIGPFSFAYEDPGSKVETLRQYAHHPPGLDHVSDLVLALAPTTVSVSLSAELAFLLVSSDSLAVGFQADYTVKNFISRYGAIRRQLGV